MTSFFSLLDNFDLRAVAGLRLPLPVWVCVFLCVAETESAPAAVSTAPSSDRADGTIDPAALQDAVVQLWQRRTVVPPGGVVQALAIAALLRYPDVLGLSLLDGYVLITAVAVRVVVIVVVLCA